MQLAGSHKLCFILISMLLALGLFVGCSHKRSDTEVAKLMRDLEVDIARTSPPSRSV